MSDASGLSDNAWKGKEWKHDGINTHEIKSRILFFTLDYIKYLSLVPLWHDEHLG